MNKNAVLDPKRKPQRAHAILSASGGDRWAECTPSARLEEKVGGSTSEWAEEGTLGHRMSEYIVKYRLRRIPQYRYEQAMAKLRKSKHYTVGLYNYCKIFASYVIEQYNRFPGAVLLIEHKVDLNGYIPEGFGAVDYIILWRDTAVIIDLKMGKGVEVHAENNTQQKIYALGVLAMAVNVFEINNIEIHIYQPRIDNIDVWEVPAKDVVKWGNEVLRPKALIAFEGKGEFVPGDHCKFCKVKARCRALFDYATLGTQSLGRSPDQLSDEQIAFILDRAKVISDWLYAVKDHALMAAINRGKKWPGYKLVNGRSNRRFTDEARVIRILEKKGFTGITETALLGIGALEAKIGKEAFDKYVHPYLVKSDGKPTLAPLSDKRIAFNSLDSAKEDFKND